ncbi:substrate-binding periplasmic protein [Aestuariispira insulae]|uniref:ABC-type amino acid transport substrate-binding protein n=1 Tax=Aestuariispira insulae TaxID=1461337 RepID=A0A3D9HIE2_9PROT|nr:transporter substrate-binding domain-containing protein [Aestuariispira insulae]RED49228.1 ABC-type amino acid transport substrate-binding protein [Aestuariispira insulae]
MTRQVALILGLAAAIIFSPIAGGALACDKVFSIYYVTDYRPYSGQDDNGDLSGFDNALVQAVIRAMGCDYEMVTLPWKRGLSYAEQGKLDIVPYASVTPEREAFARFSIPYRYEKVGMIVRADSRYDINSLEDVVRLGLRIGYYQGTYWGEEFETFREREDAQNYIFPYSNNKQGLQLVLKNRVDLLIGDPAVQLYEARQLGIGSQLRDHAYVLRRSPVHFLASRKTVSASMMKRFNDELRQLMLQPDYQETYGPAALERELIAPPVTE